MDSWIIGSLGGQSICIAFWSALVPGKQKERLVTGYSTRSVTLAPLRFGIWLAAAVCVFEFLAPPTFAQEASATLSREQADFFENKIRPVLAERCYECHSTKAKKLKGSLLLDSRDGLMKGGEKGHGIVSGDPGRSRLIKAIRYEDEDLQMPPKSQLTPEQVADFETWVRMGAPYPRHGYPIQRLTRY